MKFCENLDLGRVSKTIAPNSVGLQTLVGTTSAHCFGDFAPLQKVTGLAEK